MENMAHENKILSPPTFPKTEIDEDDCEFYFLQPTSSPYNMSAKIEEANKALYAEDIAGNVKQNKVKFKEELTDFEPDLTDDDVQSIESYNEIEVIDEVDEISRSDEIKYIVNNRESIEASNEGQDTEEIMEEIEEVASDSDITPISPHMDFENEKQPVVPTAERPLKHINRSASSKLNSDEIRYKTPNSRKKTPYLKHVECKKHCIDSLESNLELCIRKLQINEKLPQCPTLKLQKRYCCIDNTCKNEQKLPNYSGLKSEYGLTREQWTKKYKTNELARAKIQKRQEISKEFKKRKIEQNELIFCEWLRNLKYKKQNIDPEILKKYYIPSSYLMQPNRCDSNNNSKANSIEREQRMQNINRPKTSNSLPNSNRNLSNRAIRPSTSHLESRDVFIEIPPEILSREVQLGNLVISSIKNNGNNTITIVAVKNL